MSDWRARDNSDENSQLRSPPKHRSRFGQHRRRLRLRSRRGPQHKGGLRFRQTFQGRISWRRRSVRFYDGLFLSFFYLQRCFFFMLFLQEENAAKAEKNDHKNDILNHRNQRNQFWTASSKSFSESYMVLFKSHVARRFTKRNHALDRAVFAEYANLSRPKFRAALAD